MSVLAGVFAAVAALLVVWSYLLYPIVIERLASSVSKTAAPETAPPGSVEALVAAADEESVIAGRVRDLLAQSDARGLIVRVGCDGCRDDTARRAREAGDGRVSVQEFPARRGKAAVLNDLVASSAADLLVFTDANTRFDSDAVARLVERFADPSVGAVCGRLVLDADSAIGAAETAFWDRETRLKEKEGELGVCLGANGAIYAARRELVRPLPDDTTSMDDFLIPARIARGGKRVVFAADAVAREASGRDAAAEMARRFRIGIGAGQVLRRERWLFDFRRHRLLALAFVSRKAARWLAPVATLAALAAALFDSALRPAAAAALVLVALMALFAPTFRRLRGPAGTLYYFVVINVALAAGVLAGLAGYRRPAWRRAR